MLILACGRRYHQCKPVGVAKIDLSLLEKLTPLLGKTSIDTSKTLLCFVAGLCWYFQQGLKLVCWRRQHGC